MYNIITFHPTISERALLTSLPLEQMTKMVLALAGKVP